MEVTEGKDRVVAGGQEESVVQENQVDRFVGGRVQLQRMMLRMSPEELATNVGITAGELASYEGGEKRLPPALLLSFSQILDVPVSFFFDGLEQFGTQPAETKLSSPGYATRQPLDADFALEGRLLIAFRSIPSQDGKLAVVEAAEIAARRE